MKHHLMSLAAAAFVAAAILGGASASAQEPEYGGEMVLAFSADPETLFPGRTNNTSAQNAWLYALEGLVELNEDGEIVPWLAESWDVSEDGLIYTFKLREGVEFHDGTPFNAEAVAFVFDLARQEDYGYSKFLTSVEDVEADSEYEVSFHFSEPSAAFLANLTYRSMVIFSPAAYEEHGEEWMASHPVGTGPFVFESYQRGNVLRYVRNENYWQEGKPYLDAVTIQIVPDGNIRTAMLESGEVDRITGINPFILPRLEANPNIDVRIAPSVVQRYISLDNTSPHLRSRNVRQALNYAIDKAGIIQAVYNNSGAILSRAPVITEGVVGFADMTEDGQDTIFPYNPERARDLLQMAGYQDRDGNGIVEDTDGNEFVLTMVTTSDSGAGEGFKVAQLVQTMLADIGVSVELEVVENAAFWPAVNEGPEDIDHEMANLTWSVPTGDPEEPMLLLTYSKSWRPICCNRLYYGSEKVDRLTELARVETDPEARKEYVRQWMEELMRDAPMIFLPTLTLTVAERTYLKNTRIIPVGNFPARFAWIDSAEFEAQGISR